MVGWDGGERKDEGPVPRPFLMVDVQAGLRGSLGLGGRFVEFLDIKMWVRSFW